MITYYFDDTIYKRRYFRANFIWPMRRIYTVAIVLAIAILATGFQKSVDWYQYKSAGYEVAFPAEPKAQQQTVPTQIGDLKMDIRMYEPSKSGQEDDNLVYMTNVTEYPESKINSDNKANLEAVFRGGIDGSVKNVEGKLLSEKVIEMAGFPGREIKVDVKNGIAIIRARYFLVKNVMYIVQVITATEKFPNAAADRFFSSFHAQPIK